nr:MAG TPA: hypothetical protein [Bacteriophage sp.]
MIGAFSFPVIGATVHHAAFAILFMFLITYYLLFIEIPL